MRRRSREFNIFSLSAMDLFASALGAFVVIAVMLFPFYQKNAPTLAQAAQMTKEAEDLNRETKNLGEQADKDRKRAKGAADEAKQTQRKTAAIETEIKALGEQRRKGGEMLEQCRIALSKLDISEFDLVLAFDTTGSMSSIMQEMLVKLRAIVRILQKMIPSLRVGFVAFRDDAPYITKDFPLRSMDAAGLVAAEAWLKKLSAGGGTGALAVAKGIAAARNMAWRSGVSGAIIVVGDDTDDDATPHRAHRAAQAFAGRGDARTKISVIVPEATSGRDLKFFQQLARAGGGDFVRDRGNMLTSILLSMIKR